MKSFYKERIPGMKPNSKILANEIIQHLNNDIRITTTESNIFVSVIDGRAVLTGIVPTITIRDLVEEITYRVPQLYSIINYLKVREIYNHKPITDHELKMKVMFAIQLNNKLDPHRITVNALQGKIFLKGSVSLSWKKELATTIAQSFSNVKEVINEIQILEQI